MATHSSSLAWKIPWLEEPGRLQSMGCKQLDTTDLLSAEPSLLAKMVKNPPAMQETWVLSLGWEDSLEKGKATHSRLLGWRISMDRGAQSMGS